MALLVLHRESFNFVGYPFPFLLPLDLFGVSRVACIQILEIIIVPRGSLLKNFILKVLLVEQLMRIIVPKILGREFRRVSKLLISLVLLT